MSEEIMRPKKEASVKLGTFVLLIILVAIAFGGAGFLYGQKTLLTKSTASKTATATAIGSATSSTTAVSSATSAITDTTAGWKTYANSTYGFSFKYPKDWVVSEDSGLSRVYISNKTGHYDKSNVPSDYEQVWISYSASECSATNENAIKNGGDEQVAVTTDSAVINGIAETLYKSPGSDGPFAAIYWSDNNQKRFCAHTGFGASNADEITTLKTILSTFQFTK